MRLALDARTIYRPQRRGTGKNLIDLYNALAAIRPAWSVTAYHRQFGIVDPVLPPGWATPRMIEMPGDRVSAWERWRLPVAAWNDKADLLHCPANTCPNWMPVDTLVTIHDLIPLDMPEHRSPADVHRFEQAIQNACRRAAWIVTPSAYTRGRLISEFHADPQRVTVNPWPADSAMRCMPADAWGSVLRRYNVQRPYVLHFGAADPRKNTVGVIEAWSRLPRYVRGDWKLLIVGLDHATAKRMHEHATQRRVASSVVLHGFADEADIPTLLSAADVLAFPSLAEGYGLPILDAWVAHTAVLTSDWTSLPEVAGDAALLVNPADHDAISDGLARLMMDTSLRAELVSRGRRRVGKFTWHNTAQNFAWAAEQAASIRQRRRAAA